MLLGVEERKEQAQLGPVQRPQLIGSVGGQHGTATAAAVGQQEEGEEVEIAE
jgi:hypothetical protein